ncbi:MAG: hypothetical protein OdinLCB4_000105 [Candidatus Odinarchaeum yellowstonii]|uniref:DNA-binding protein n=1 Tax=Odinarchaeota yellowstonii (strain LCB_4) TaxID=1841599 RepID=A0AAF0IB31_ODILC|nr:MAG: hypothetical protein OdinLCB4_000105 [Candidatus Odinarchaeum yellowstonii]
MDELERIKLKKMKEMLQKINEQVKLKEYQEQLKQEKAKFFKLICDEEALKYLNELYKIKPAVAAQIEEILIMIVNQYGLQTKISKTDIMILERRIEGRGPDIKIKRRGKEEEDISKVLADDKG